MEAKKKRGGREKGNWMQEVRKNGKKEEGEKGREQEEKRKKKMKRRKEETEETEEEMGIVRRKER